jgi:hypothetical protein
MSRSIVDATSHRGLDAEYFNARAFAALILLVTVLFPYTGLADPSYGVAVSSNLTVDFEASPTIDTNLPDLIGGGSNPQVLTGWLEQASVQESFHEIYQGVGESGTSLFEIDYYGFASFNSGGLSVDISGHDKNNASAAYWTASGSAGYYEWMEFSGPTDASGNYVISFTAHLGPVSASNMQPAGFTYLWRVNVGTHTLAEPLAPGFSTLDLYTAGYLKELCPTLSGPTCDFIPRYTSATGEVTVPGSNPVLLLTHSLSVRVRSAEADASGASLSMHMPAGVAVTAYQPIPEPSRALLQSGTLLSLLVLARFRAKSG